ncbi:MAG: YigZ family protein [Candidatus Cloacimonadota bacterium]
MACILLSTCKHQEKIQRSEFICVLYPVTSSEEIRGALSRHQKEYATATHNCYAYVLGENQSTRYYSDAGEPAGTAGKPILNALLRGELTNTLAVVTRYYGGIKLGVKGLIEAYGGVTGATIELAEKTVYRETSRLELSCDYPCFELVQRYSHAHEIALGEAEYALEVKFCLQCPTDSLDNLKQFLDGLSRQHVLNYRQLN